MICPYCHQEAGDGAKFCRNCGAPLPANQPEPQMQQSVNPQMQYQGNPQMNMNAQQPYGGTPYQGGYQAPPKKKKGCLIAAIIAGVIFLGIAAVVVIFGARIISEIDESSIAPGGKIDCDTFVSNMESQGFDVSDDDEERITDYFNGLIGVTVDDYECAYRYDDDMQLEFYEMASEEDAIALFDYARSFHEDNNSNYSQSIIEDDGARKLIMNGDYCNILVQVGDTYLELIADYDDEEEAEVVLEVLGY